VWLCSAAMRGACFDMRALSHARSLHFDVLILHPSFKGCSIDSYRCFFGVQRKKTEGILVRVFYWPELSVQFFWWKGCDDRQFAGFIASFTRTHSFCRF